jgi:hypothetical protein
MELRCTSTPTKKFNEPRFLMGKSRDKEEMSSSMAMDEDPVVAPQILIVLF